MFFFKIMTQWTDKDPGSLPTVLLCKSESLISLEQTDV
jgi:hypothetical protein